MQPPRSFRPPAQRRSRRALRRPALGHGITLLEAVLGITVLMLTFGIAWPNYRSASARVHATAARAAMSATLFGAMRDATVNGRHAVVCPSPDETHCVDGNDWSDGWIAFIDLNDDRGRGMDEPLVGRHPALDGDVRLLSTEGRPRIVFQPNGSNAGANVTFTLCDRRGPDHALRLVLANNGRLRALPASTDAAVGCAAGW